MKKLIITLGLLTLLTCSSDTVNSNCNFLLDVGVNLTVNTNLPQFSQLAFPSNGVYVAGQGNNGIWLWRVNSSTLFAWDAADPNHVPAACSTLTDTGNSGIVTCGCEDANQYSLVNGQSFGENQQPCTLKAYRVEFIGNNTYLVTN